MKKGFTLIELLVVVLIIGILSSVALPQYTKAVEKSRATEALTLLGNLATAEQVYQMSTGSFTTDLSLLDLQLPGVGSTTTSTVTTKNFIFTVVNGDTVVVAKAQRANNGTATTGDNAYHLNMYIANDGTITRWCNTAAATTSSTATPPTSGVTAMCKNIAGGNSSGLIK